MTAYNYYSPTVTYMSLAACIIVISVLYSHRNNVFDAVVKQIYYCTHNPVDDVRVMAIHSMRALWSYFYHFVLEPLFFVCVYKISRKKTREGPVLSELLFVSF